MRKLIGTIFLVVSASCSKSPNNADFTPVTNNVTASQPQKNDVEAQILASLTQSYDRLAGRNTNGNLAWALQSAQIHINKIKRIAVSQCDIRLVETVSVQKCLFLEVMIQNPQTAMSNLSSETIALIDTLAAQMTALSKEIRLLSGQEAKTNMPYLAKSFFDGKKFVLTTSLQQGSVGTDRVYNLESLSVSLSVNSNRLVVLQNKTGQFSSTDAVDSIVTSYPIVDTKSDGNETYFQIDFSQPANLKMYRNALGDGDPTLDITADVVIPTIAHADKSLNKSLNSTQYFNGGHSQLVMDSLVLVSGQFQPTATDRSLFKNAMQPTMRVVQGLSAETEKEKSFSDTQALELDVATMDHLGKNTKDLSGGQDVPFFATSPFLSNQPMGGIATKSMVKKFDASEEILFVLSANTPAAAVPVLKAALESYNELFESFKNNKATKISALSADEFAAKVQISGVDIPQFPIAADPRVNMISWSSDDSLGSAWATTIAHPFSGRIISGDVMMSGNLWARIGCSSYLAKAWAMKVVKTDKLSSLLAPEDLRQSWSSQCAAALTKLGIGSRGTGPTNGTAAALTDTNAIFSGANETTLDNVVLPARYQSAVEAGGSDNVNRVLRASTATSTQSTVILSLGSNVLRFKPGCMRHPEDAMTETTQFGAPGVNLALVKDPSEGALAMVRSVAMHELGHLFGMRHNFAGSLTSSKLAPTSPQSPIPFMADSDSFMDYNDYGVDMSSGAMSDYTSPLGGKGTRTFGAYDVVTLATIYNLNTSALVFETKSSFCTDRNVKNINGNRYGDCKQDDYGPDGITYGLHQLNQDLMTLKAAGLPLDGGAGARIQSRLFGTIQGLIIELFMAQERLSQSYIKGDEKEALLRKVALITRGDSTAPLLTQWSAITGEKVAGLFDALQPRLSDFKNENAFLRKYDALIAQKIANQSFVDSLGNLANFRRAQPGDLKYTSIFRDIANVADANWKSKFISQYAAEVVIPKGTAVEFSYFDDGKIMSGYEAKRNGEPVIFALDEPMLNHLKVVSVKKLTITGTDGQDKEVVATVTGKYPIGDLKQIAAGIAVMDIYGTTVSKRILDDKKVLECLAGLVTEACPTSKTLTDLSLVAARTLAQTYQKLYDFIQDPDSEVTPAQ